MTRHFAIFAVAAFVPACVPLERYNGDLHAHISAATVERFTPECGSVTVTDRAFHPIEITGDGRTDFVFIFARVICANAANLWTGTGGGLMQVWTDHGGSPRLLLEQQIFAFTSDRINLRLITDQHGGFCSGGAGPETCRVVYEWDPASRSLRVIERRFRPDAPFEPLERND